MKCSSVLSLASSSFSSFRHGRICSSAFRISSWTSSSDLANHPANILGTNSYHKYFYVQSVLKNQRMRTFSTAPALNAEMIDITFVTSDGKKYKTKGKIGDNFLDVVVNNNVDLDGFGACEGTLACSTCHLVFKKEDFDRIKDKITDEELDMLDLAYGLTDTSRLGCQVTLTKDLDGVEVHVPAGVNDARS